MRCRLVIELVTFCGTRELANAMCNQWCNHTSGVRGVRTGIYIIVWHSISQCYSVIIVRSIIQAV